jgi:hypothetical protein
MLGASHDIVCACVLDSVDDVFSLSVGRAALHGQMGGVAWLLQRACAYVPCVHLGRCLLCT